MKRIIILILAVLAFIILTALIFDFGRREAKAPETNLNASSTGITQQNYSLIYVPIIVNNIKDNQAVSNPIKIAGKARGDWFFEGIFPVELIDDNGNIIASTTAKADGEWATVDFVNFTATLEYIKSTSTSRALIVLRKDNPSDNPDLDQSIFIPVILK